MLTKFLRYFSRDLNAGKASAFEANSMKSLEVNGDKNAVLLYNSEGKFYATGGKCSHYGAPLVMGAFTQEKVYCPWHCACFDIKTGSKLTSPGLQNIPVYQTEINASGDVIVKIPDNVTDPANYVDGEISKKQANDSRKFVIVGGGAAGLACAETLRKNKYTGEIIMITKENITPYDRVSLSKNFKMTASKTVLKNDEFYEKFGIEVRKNMTVSAVNPENKTVTLDKIENFQFDKLLIATGSSAKVPKPYANAVNLTNVFTIRTVRDHERIKPLVESSQNIIIIGGSFLGLEAANAIKSAFPEKSVSVFEQETVPLQRIMGQNIGELLRKRAESKGIQFSLGKSAESINNQGSKAVSITIDSTEVTCDLILLATGAQINTSFLPEQLLNKDGSVRVSGFLQTDHPDIYAAGDIASFPSVHTGGISRVEHWAVAQDQGIHAGLNMLGLGKVYTGVPFFWSNQAVNIQYIGVPGEFGFNESKDIGKETEGHISYFFSGNKIAGIGIGNWPGAALVVKAMAERGLLPSKQQVHAGKRFKDIAEDFKKIY